MKTFPILLVPLIAGCLSSAPKAPTHWTIDWERAAAQSASPGKLSADSVRIASVEIRAPYGGTRLAVLRQDGSIAFDAFNAFAVAPAQLLNGATFDATVASGIFGRVVTAHSAASARHTLEVCVTKLALDCRSEGKRVADVALTLTLLDGRRVVANVRAEGTADAADDYSAAFSAAYARAMQGALGKLTFN